MGVGVFVCLSCCVFCLLLETELKFVYEIFAELKCSTLVCVYVCVTVCVCLYLRWAWKWADSSCSGSCVDIGMQSAQRN